MPITFDAAGQTAAQTSTLSMVATLTIASNAVLVVGIANTGAGHSISSVIANGTALTQLGRVQNNTGVTLHIFGLTAAPSGVVSISANVVGTAFTWAMQAASYLGAKAANCFGTVVSGTSASTTNINFSVSSTTTDRVVGFFASDSDISAVNATTRLSAAAHFGQIFTDITGAATTSLSATVITGTVAFLGLPIMFSVAAVAARPWGLATMGCGV